MSSADQQPDPRPLALCEHVGGNGCGPAYDRYLLQEGGKFLESNAQPGLLQALEQADSEVVRRGVHLDAPGFLAITDEAVGKSAADVDVNSVLALH